MESLIVSVIINFVIYNGMEWSAFQNQRSAQRDFDLKSQVWFQTKIARHQDQLPLYYSHFEITEFNQYQYFIKRAKI